MSSAIGCSRERASPVTLRRARGSALREAGPRENSENSPDPARDGKQSRETETIMWRNPVFALAASPEGGSLLMQFVPLALVVAIFYFIILLPLKR